MINLHQLRYVRLGTRDIDAAAKYASDILGLQLVRREGGWAYLRSDERDHTLVYFEGDPTHHTIAFDVVANEMLEHAGTLLEQNGFRVHVGSRDGCVAVRRRRRFRTTSVGMLTSQGRRIALRVSVPDHGQSPSVLSLSCA
ncbi:VOC family protein [Paraburkholderia franconis]|uniref:VOC family protein n=1 Tax=Paraburkholderia franconis TaxID=2654983 RepID=UPI001D0F8B74|nr:VOC family protein [Paraburkholderia franconis]